MPKIRRSDKTSNSVNPASIVPAGTIVQFAGTIAPEGWAICDGGTLSRTDDVALFSVIGTIYGAGNGTTTFNIPDFKGRQPVGVGYIAPGGGSQAHSYGLNNKGGTIDRPITLAEMPQHTHGYLDFQMGYRYPGWKNGGADWAQPLANVFRNTDPIGSSAYFDRRTPYICVNFMIKR